jgi:hypothetical protein
MQKTKFTAMIILAGVIIFFSSCNSGKDKKTDTNVADSTATIKEPVTVPSGPMKIMMVKHQVANYAKWKSGYEAHDSARLANGLHSYIIARGVEDSNMVLIAMKMDDPDKAKAMAASPDMKAVMKKAGVIGTPTIDFVENVMYDTTALQQTARLMVRHKVKDWDVWKKSFDGHKQARMDAGLTDRLLGYTIGDNHNVTIVFAVSDMAKAKAFINSKDLKDRMKTAGVDGPPSFFFYKVVQKY